MLVLLTALPSAGCRFVVAGLGEAGDGSIADEGDASVWNDAASSPPDLMGVDMTLIGRLEIKPPAQTLRQGACSSSVTVEIQDLQGNPQSDGPSLEIQLQASSPGAVQFFESGDSTCTTPKDHVTASAGIAHVNFRFKGVSLGAHTVTASAPGYGSAAQDETIIGVVTRGKGEMTGTSVQFSIVPPLENKAKAFLVFQAESNDHTPKNASVRCYLKDVETVRCDRYASDTPVHVKWQVVSLPGLDVQHIQTACNITWEEEQVIQLEHPVDEAKTFLLFSAKVDGQGQNDNDFRIMWLAAGVVRHLIGWSFNCGPAELALQVIQLDGARVIRGHDVSIAGHAASTSFTLPNAGVDLGRSFLLYSYRTSNGGGTICNRMVRGSLVSGSQIQFSRGDGEADCYDDDGAVGEISWEVVELPGVSNSVEQRELTLDDGAVAGSLPLGLEPASHMVFAGGQWTSGQATGEGTYASTSSQADVIGALIGAFELDGQNLLFERKAGLGRAHWSVFVARFAP